MKSDIKNLQIFHVKKDFLVSDFSSNHISKPTIHDAYQNLNVQTKEIDEDVSSVLSLINKPKQTVDAHSAESLKPKPKNTDNELSSIIAQQRNALIRK